MAQVNRQPRTAERKARRIRIRPAYIALLILMGLFTYTFIEKTKELQALTRQANALRAENQQTLRDNGRIQTSINYYKNPTYIVEQARAYFGYTRPGDVTIMTEPRYERPTVRVAPRRSAPAPATWKQWWSSFFG